MGVRVRMKVKVGLELRDVVEVGLGRRNDSSRLLDAYHQFAELSLSPT